MHAVCLFAYLHKLSIQSFIFISYFYLLIIISLFIYLFFIVRPHYKLTDCYRCQSTTVKILKIGTPEIITIIVLQLEQLDFTVQYCVQKMQTE